MITESITAVALPAGVSGSRRQQLNVYLAPRLSGAPLLSAFADWIKWPELVQAHGLRFDLASGTHTATVAADTTQLRPDIWAAIFGHDAIVQEYPDEGFDQRLVVSYPSRGASDYLQWAARYWAYFLGSGAEYGDGKDRGLRQITADLTFRDGRQSTLKDSLSQLRVQLWREQTATAGGGTSSSSGDTPEIPAAAVTPSDPLTPPEATRDMVERFALYHHPPDAPGRRPLPSAPAELAELVDFHKALTAIAAYPSLLRALGLVFPIELPNGFCAPSPAGGAYETVAVTTVLPGWSWATPPVLTQPMTAYVSDASTFAAAPATDPQTLAASGPSEPADIVDGFLAVNPTDYHVVGVDLDGALLKLMALADSLENASYVASLSPDGTASAAFDDDRLPALRSAGLSLLADGRAQELLRAIQDNTAFGSSITRPLNARDLNRGYRIDVLSDRTKTWCSLHRRDGTYRFGHSGLTLRTNDEEGFTQLAVTQPADDPTREDDSVAASAGAPQPSTDLYVNERIARWNGWSLSAPRPSQPINRSPDPSRAADPDPTADQPVTTIAMSTTFQAHARSLPALRFGERYQLRVRAVDLAGESPPLDATAPAGMTAPSGGMITHYRYEPVGPPVVVLREQPGPGGSLAELVIRTHNTDPSLDAVAVPDSDERHIAPPRVGEQMIEQHGLLDDASGRLRGDTVTYDLIVGLDNGEIPHDGSTQIVPGTSLPVNYFADPLARGAALTSLPQTEPATDGTVTAGRLAYAPAAGADPRPTAVTFIPFGTGWPGRQAFRIRLVDGFVAPTWDDASRLLTVSLAKAQTAAVALSAYVDPLDLDLMGVWDWVRTLFDELDTDALEQSEAGLATVDAAAWANRLTAIALAGGFEQVTPSAPLQFTHAVQQPLGLPIFTRLPIIHAPGDPIVAATLANQFSPLTAWRISGSHHAVLLGALQINGASTAAIDLEATWTEWVDDLSDPGPTELPAAGHVDRIPISSLEEGTLAADGTGVRLVASYLPAADALWFSAPFDSLDGVSTPDAVSAPVHQLGDTRHRMIRYRATASSRFAEYFPDPSEVTSRTGPSLTVSVPSSARPLPPDIAYVVPLFGWDTEVTTDTKTQIRKGNGLRVYVERPWYSSGAGELLGVALWPISSPPPTDDDLEATKPYVTQWGLDPGWQTGDLQPMPAYEVFALATHTATNLTLEETPQLVDVAGHPVEYDADRRLWYCDITLENETAYAPFVRLALARYQPRSIAGKELSKVTITDYAQLTPDRSASLTTDPQSPSVSTLVVAGIAPAGPTTSYFAATVEQRRDDVRTDLGWAQAPGAATVTLATPPPSAPGSVLMSATITFPQPPPVGRYRVVIREFEVLQVDPPDAILSDGPELAERLVFAAVMPIDSPPERTAP